MVVVALGLVAQATVDQAEQAEGHQGELIRTHHRMAPDDDEGL